MQTFCEQITARAQRSGSALRWLPTKRREKARAPAVSQQGAEDDYSHSLLETVT